MRRSVAIFAVALGALAAAGDGARADVPVTSPISGRNYAVELYNGVAFGDSATIAMGGAAVANAAGAAGTLINVSASAVRSTTDHDWWSIDVGFDLLSNSLSSDAENSGLPQSTNNGGFSAVTGGLALRFHDWAGAITGTIEEAQVAGSDAGSAFSLYGETLRIQLAVAHWIPKLDLAVGAALDYGEFAVGDNCLGCKTLFAITAVGAEAGATWIPKNQPFRLGANAQTGLDGGDVTSANCNPMSCDGYILPSDVVAPWQVAVGAAYRFGPTPWNIEYPGWFRDERALTVAADLVVIGSAAQTNGLEAWGDHELQRESEHPALSPRLGAELEIFPGRLRLRAGTYWEPGLLAEVSGRPHLTFGAEVHVFHFNAWGPRRVQLTLTGDVASRYENASLSIGFWH
jgi:hypothetical protein